MGVGFPLNEMDSSKKTPDPQPRGLLVLVRGLAVRQPLFGFRGLQQRRALHADAVDAAVLAGEQERLPRRSALVYTSARITMYIHIVALQALCFVPTTGKCQVGHLAL